MTRGTATEPSQAISLDTAFQAQKSPEIALSLIRGYLSQNQRITAQLLFTNIIEPLENNDKTLQCVLLDSGDRWLPMLISSTGLSMSNVSKSTRCVLFDRFWRQIIDKNITVTVDMFNARLQVYLENEHEFVPAEELNYLQELNIQPNQETFQHVLEQFARKGDVESFRHMVRFLASALNSTRILDTDQLSALLSSDAKIDELIDQLPQIRNFPSEKEIALVENKTLAEWNIGQQPRIEQLKREVITANEEAANLKKEVDALKLKTDAGTRTLDVVSDLLQVAVGEADDDAEIVTREFYDGSLPADLFIKSFLDKKTLAHTRKIKSDRLMVLLGEQQYARPQPAMRTSMPPSGMPYPQQQRASHAFF